MPHLANRRNRPVSLDPKSMSIVDLQALPEKSLILLASARNLVTTGTKPLGPTCVRTWTSPANRNTNAGDDRNSDTRETSEDRHGRNSQQTDQQTTNSAFSDDQLNQLRSLITEAVVLQQPPFVPPTVPLLSPVSDHLPSGGQDETPLANTAQRQCMQSAAFCCHTITPLEKCWNGPSDAHANLRFLVLLVLSYFQEIATDFPETSQVS